MRIPRWLWLGLSVSLTMVTSGSAQPAAPAHGVARNTAEMTFVTFPGMPTCATASVQNGDPAQGGSIILARMAAGCVFPWHWHTPSEHLMIVSGVAQAEMKDEKPVTLRAGAFALMPSRHVHRFRCDTACSLYVYSDAAFDMHYVDSAGAELSPAAALSAVKEVPGEATK